MSVMRSVKQMAVGAVILASSSGIPMIGTLANAQVDNKTLTAQVLSLKEIPSIISSITPSHLMEPGWLAQQDAAEAAVQATRNSARIVTYDVSTKGMITANVAEFRNQANATLNDPRGWARLGAKFQEVASGGAFTLVLSEASQLPVFSPGCSPDYSCRAGRYIIINQDRWLGATSPWNQAGKSLRDYRHLAINHETGHWLGHDDAPCGGAGQSAPVMQQQSVNLNGCTFNSWPLEIELWSTQLGVNR